MTANITDLVVNPPGWKPESVRGYTEGARRVVTALGSVSPWLEARFEAAYAAAVVKRGTTP